jgi:hypothetical protein
MLLILRFVLVRFGCRTAVIETVTRGGQSVACATVCYAAYSMLPENVFDDLLGSFSLQKPNSADHQSSFEAIPSSMATDGKADFVQPPVTVHHRTDCTISVQRLSERLKSELRDHRHKHTDELIGAVLALYAANPARSRMSLPPRLTQTVKTLFAVR